MRNELEDLVDRAGRLEVLASTLERQLDLKEMQFSIMSGGLIGAATRDSVEPQAGPPASGVNLEQPEHMLRSVLLHQGGNTTDLRKAVRYPADTRREEGIVMDDLEGFAAWRDAIESRVSTLQALSKVQSDHTARLIRLEDGQAEMKADIAETKVGLSKVEAGIKTIIGPLAPDVEGDTPHGSCLLT